MERVFFSGEGLTEGIRRKVKPTGARPNGWQEKGPTHLPNSHLVVSVSTRYYRFLDEDLPAVIPHQHIPLTWEDFRAGRDPAMEWIVTQPL